MAQQEAVARKKRGTGAQKVGITCWRCQEDGHLQKDCDRPRKNLPGSFKKKKAEARNARQRPSSGAAKHSSKSDGGKRHLCGTAITRLAAQRVALTGAGVCPKLGDTGASSHVWGRLRRSEFLSLEYFKNPMPIHWCDDEEGAGHSVMAQGIGTVEFCTLDGTLITLSDMILHGDLWRLAA